MSTDDKKLKPLPYTLTKSEAYNMFDIPKKKLRRIMIAIQKEFNSSINTGHLTPKETYELYKHIEIMPPGYEKFKEIDDE